MRQLATIQRITELRPIEGADKIEVARILGWEVVVVKDQFQVGDLVAYVEVDSILPETEWSEFMRPRHFKVKTIRMKKQISQGIAFPLSVLPDFSWSEGEDVTETLGITKYEPPTPEANVNSIDKRQYFPKWMPEWLMNLLIFWFPKKYKKPKQFDIWNYISKTDETRVQNCGGLLKRYEGQMFCATEKLDGSSITAYLNKGKFGVCSRNIDLDFDPVNIFWKTVDYYKLEDKMRGFFEGRNVALQGELVGEGIQGNKMGLQGACIYWYNAFDIDIQMYFTPEQFAELMQELQLMSVPDLGEFILVNDIPSLATKATKKSTINPKTWAEGIVCRMVDGNQGRHSRVSFKSVNPEFLLKHGV